MNTMSKDVSKLMKELQLRVDRQSAMLEGISRFIKGEKYQVSSGIDESITYGYGKLDEYGFWEHPIPEGLAKLDRENRKLREIVEMYKRAVLDGTKQLQEYLDGLGD